NTDQRPDNARPKFFQVLQERHPEHAIFFFARARVGWRRRWLLATASYTRRKPVTAAGGDETRLGRQTTSWRSRAPALFFRGIHSLRLIFRRRRGRYRVLRRAGGFGRLSPRLADCSVSRFRVHTMGYRALR